MNTLDSIPTPCLKGISPRCYQLKQKLTIALGVAAAALLLPANASAQCVTAAAGGVWHNTAMTAQTGTFTATFDATPSASPTNSVVALSDGAQTAYANFSCLARFNPAGHIDARNGGAFTAAATIAYKAGVSYHFRLVVNVAAKTYSIYVTPAGGSELTVGLNYAFRISATTLNWWGVSVETAGTGGVGTVTVCNFSTGGTVPKVATPTFSPAPGTSSSTVSVSISTATSSAQIRYTTDGSQPSETAGTLYSGPVTISVTTTLNAIAYESGFTDSAVASGTYTIAGGQTWTLVWSDEFTGPAGSAPDATKWNYDTGGGGWGNGELEFYCSPTSGTPCNPGNPNISLDGNGNLVIKAINNGGTWTSGRMKTAGKFQVQYGRIEARIRFATGAGVWPAFWMLGTNIGTVGWPTCGEQDIMEWVPKYTPTTTSSHIHGPGYSGGAAIGTDFTFPNGGMVNDANYHTYGVVWAANKLQYYRDDWTKPFLTITPANIPAGTQWVYNHPFSILLNLAIGGGFPGAPNASTPNPVVMLVDYVRVYQ